jgi:hypothetical protein
MPDFDTDRLAALIAAKSQVAELLVRLARRQLELATGGQTQALLRLLAAKQSILDQLHRLEREIDPFRAQDPESRRWRSPADRTACQRQAEQAAALLAEAMSLEKQGEAVMLRRRDAAAAELSAAQSAADARSAYAGGPVQASVSSALQYEG